MDVYDSFRFRVTWDGRAVAGISRVSALRRVTDVVEHRDVGDRSIVRFPGRSTFEPIVLERGVTRDREFEQWAAEIQAFSDQGTGLKQRIPEAMLDAFRKEVHIEVLDAAGRTVLAYVVHKAWVSEYQALPELDAGGNAVAIERITLQHDGWERDPGAAEPGEPRA